MNMTAESYIIRDQEEAMQILGRVFSKNRWGQYIFAPKISRDFSKLVKTLREIFAEVYARTNAKAGFDAANFSAQFFFKETSHFLNPAAADKLWKLIQPKTPTPPAKN